MVQQSKFINYREAANLLGVPLGTLYFWVSQRKIPYIRYGNRHVVFDVSEIEAWIESRRVSSVEENCDE